MADNIQNLPPVVESMDGPGKSSNPINIKGDIKNVARLSKKSKLVLSALVTILVAGIIVGTMSAGNKSSDKATPQDNTNTGADSVGTVAPDADIKPKPKEDANPANPANPLANSTTESPPNNNGPLTARGTAPTDNKNPPSGAAAGAPLTPAQQYQAWLVQQHYKRIEGKILAADAATTAETSKGGASGMQGSSGALANNDANTKAGMNRIQDAQAAALKMMANDPAAAQSPDMQKLLKALSGGNSGDGSGNDAGQKANKQFLAGTQQPTTDDGYLTSVETPKASDHELFAGSVIPAVLVSGIDSDLPGVITAMVRQTVYDSLNPGVVLIPQGTKLVGEYSSDVAYGQSRVLAAWNRLIFPNGATIDLKGMMGADGQGLSGYNDQVDNHYLRTFGSAILISLLGVGAQLSQPQNASMLTTPTAASTATSAMASSLNQAGTMLLQKNLDVQPTLKIRQGYLFNVMVSRTMIMPPYLSR